MKKKFKKSSILLMVFLVFIISLSAISATDPDSTDDTLNQVEDSDIEEIQSNTDESSKEILATNDVNKTFTDFNTDITDKTEINL